jgi:hypothetical protein
MRFKCRELPKRILGHLEKWARLYEVSGVVLALFISFLSLQLTHDALRLQRDEFALRNRPLLTLRNARFFDTDLSRDGEHISKRMEVEIANVSSVPANGVVCKCDLMVNGKKIKTTTWEIFGLAEAQGYACDVFFCDDILKATQKSDPAFQVFYEMTYSGMLGERNDAYRTSGEIYYVNDEKQFKYRGTMLR